MKGCLLQCSLRVFRLLTLAVQKLSQPSRAENITQRFSIVTAKSRCARLLDAREGELHFLHFFHVTFFAQPRSKAEELKMSITLPICPQNRHSIPKQLSANSSGEKFGRGVSPERSRPGRGTVGWGRPPGKRNTLHPDGPMLPC